MEFEIDMELINENEKHHFLQNDNKIRIDILTIDFKSSFTNENTNLFLFVLSPDKKSELILKIKANEKSQLINLNKKVTALKDSRIYIYTNDKEISANFKIIGSFEEIAENIKENTENEYKLIDKNPSYNKLSGKLN